MRKALIFICTVCCISCNEDLKKENESLKSTIRIQTEYLQEKERMIQTQSEKIEELAVKLDTTTKQLKAERERLVIGIRLPL